MVHIAKLCKNTEMRYIDYCAGGGGVGVWGGHHRLSAAEMQPTDKPGQSHQGPFTQRHMEVCARKTTPPPHTNKCKVSRTSPQTRRQPVSQLC